MISLKPKDLVLKKKVRHLKTGDYFYVARAEDRMLWVLHIGDTRSLYGGDLLSRLLADNEYTIESIPPDEDPFLET